MGNGKRNLANNVVAERNIFRLFAQPRVTDVIQGFWKQQPP